MFLAPELLKKFGLVNPGDLTKEGDMYAFGILMFQVRDEDHDHGHQPSS